MGLREMYEYYFTTPKGKAALDAAMKEVENMGKPRQVKKKKKEPNGK
jgi:hypothetical protein